MTPTPRIRARRWPDLAAGAVALGACAVCCVGPLPALLGGIGVASPAAAAPVPALAALAVLTAGAAVWWWARRRRARGRSTAPVIDVGLPAAAPSSAPVSGSSPAGVRR